MKVTSSGVRRLAVLHEGVFLVLYTGGKYLRSGGKRQVCKLKMKSWKSGAGERVTIGNFWTFFWESPRAAGKRNIPKIKILPCAIGALCLAYK
jgi:hypothetical protein